VGLLVGLEIGILVGRIIGVLIVIGFFVLGLLLTGLLVLLVLVLGLILMGLFVGRLLLDFFKVCFLFLVELFLTGLGVGLLTKSSVLETGLRLSVGLLVLSSVLETGLLRLSVGLLVLSSVLETGLLRPSVGLLVLSSVLETGLRTTGVFFTDDFGLETGIVLEPSSVFELLGESSVLEVEVEVESDPLLGFIEGLDLPLFPFPLVVEPLKFDGRFEEPLLIIGDGLQFPVFPPTFFFNQSRPLLTALSATCLVTLLTLFASVSKIFAHKDGATLFGGESLLFLFILDGRLFELEEGDICVFGVFGVFGVFTIFGVLGVFTILLLLTLTLVGLTFTIFVTPDPTLGLIFKFLRCPTLTPFLFPLQKLLNPFFKHCIPFLIAICFSFAAAAFFNAAAPPVLAMAAIVNPTLTILPIFFNFLRIRTRFEGSEETIKVPFDILAICLDV
jgi:hypothetical protein